MNIARLARTIQRHEGVRLTAYKDSLGNWTIGYGHRLPAAGSHRQITMDDAERMFADDLLAAIDAAHSVVPTFRTLANARQEVVVNMAFNLGQTRLGGFKKMLAAIGHQEWNTAADEMLNSEWAKQVGARAIELATMMRTGVV